MVKSETRRDACLKIPDRDLNDFSKSEPKPSRRGDNRKNLSRWVCAAVAESRPGKDNLKYELCDTVLISSLSQYVNLCPGILKSLTPRSLRKQPKFGDATTGFPAKWRLRNERRNSVLMRHYQDLGSASGWLVPMRHDQSEALPRSW